MTFTELFSTWMPIITFIGMIFLAFAYWYTQIKSGSNKAKQDAAGVAGEVIGTYKEQISQLKEAVAKMQHDQDEEKKSSQEKINKLTQEIGVLQGALKAKDEQIATLQGRNPEIENMLVKLSSSMEVLHDIKEFMAELHKETVTSRTILETQELRHAEGDPTS